MNYLDLMISQYLIILIWDNLVMGEYLFIEYNFKLYKNTIYIYLIWLHLVNLLF
jgi:hypothetical protein